MLRVLKIRVNGRGPQADAGNSSGGILQSDGAGRRTRGERQSEERVGAQPGNDVGGGILGHDRIRGADRGLPILKRIPGEADARLKVLVVGLVGLGRGNKRATGHVEIREASGGFRGGGIPGEAETDVESEVRLPPEAILHKDIVRRLQDLVVAGTELIGEGVGPVVEEVGEGSEIKTSDVFRNVVVVGAPDFSAKRKGVPAPEPAQSVIQHNGGIATALWFAGRAAKPQRSRHIDEWQTRANGRACWQDDVKRGRIQQPVGSKG
jgi:hypothetical protein